MRQAPSPQLANQERLLRSETAELAPGQRQGASPTMPWETRWLERVAATPLGEAVARYGPPLPLGLVLGAYALAALVIPTLAPVSISDDWTYVRSVEILHDTGRLEVLPVAAAAVVFQTVWAWLFTLVFGMSFGVVRLATVTLTFLSGLAFYGLCLELGIEKGRSALGTAAYLFNPLAFVLGYTFMSDPYFAATLTITLYFYARGLHPGQERPWSIVGGSAAAACAFLVRVHGLGIPLGVTIWLLATRRIGRNRGSVLLLLRVWAIPIAVALWYWLIFARGLPSQQTLFLDEAQEAWFDDAWLLAQRLTYFELVYSAFFALPILLGALFGVVALVRFRWRWAWLGVAAWGLVLVLGLRHFADKSVHLLSPDRRWMPYIPHFFGRSGPGSRDLRGGFPDVAPDWVWPTLTWVCIGGSLMLAIALCRRVHFGSARAGGMAGMLLVCGVIQAGGPVPQSLLFRDWVISLDRYLLPLLPFVIALTLWGLRDVRLNLPVAWTATVLIAAVAIAGTRDALVFQRNVWNMGEYAIAQGIPMTRLDAGYAWDAYHLWEFSDRHDIPSQTPPEHYVWWTSGYAPATDSAFIVSTSPDVPGYYQIAYVEYSSWLQTEPTYLYLMQRNDVAWPPADPFAGLEQPPPAAPPPQPDGQTGG